jgi:hypothetical protein
VTALQVLTLSLHFLAMNFLLGGIVAVLFGGFPDRWRHPTVQRLIGWFPSVMAATVSLGVAPLLFTQLIYGRFFYSAAIVSGWIWLAVVPLLMLAYFSFYAAALTESPGPHQGRLLGVGLAALVLVSLIYSATFALGERLDLQHQLYQASQSGFTLNPDWKEWGLRWLHMLLGALTVGGFFVGVVGREEEASFAIGKRFFLLGMTATILVGIAYLGTLGADLRPFMRGPGSKVLGGAVVATLASAFLFAKRRLLPASVLLFLSLVGMVLTRHFLRLVHLTGTFDPATIPVQPDWGPFGIFMICFVGMLLGLGWMAKLYGAPAGESWS